MTIKEYVKIKKISYRELARRLNISVTYLCDLSKGKRKTISEQVFNKFKKNAPEIDIIVETKKYYRIKEN